jgi:aminoglycoside phosphotransferase (APT) family kinase protein
VNIMVARAQVRSEQKEHLRRRGEEFTGARFIERRVVPLLPELRLEEGRPSWLMSEVVRAKGTGRLTFRYDFGGGTTVYGKLYTDELGAHSYRALSALWGDGFGGESRYRVPEPLGFFEDENFLLMRGAEGFPVADLLAGSEPGEVIPSVRAAARWLAHLHASRVECAPTEAPCERVKVFKLSDMLAKAAAAYPEQVPQLLDLVQRIRRVAPAADARLVPTHGQFTPANVFLRGDEVSVIDLDRICLSDPAKDVAMFIHRLRCILFKDYGATEQAQRVADAFLEEYRYCSGANPPGLPYYTALYSLKGFAKTAKDHGPDDPERRPLEEFYLREFARHLDGPGGGGAAAAPAPAPAGQPPTAEAAAAKGGKEELGRWAVNVTAEDFIGRHVFPALGGGGGVARCETTVVQNTGTGRLTLRYDFDGGRTVYAKLFTDELGAHSYRVNRTLWDAGFDEESRFRVPEPLAFLPEHNLFLMRAVEGRPLAAALFGDESGFTLVEGAEEAARWLAAFHRTPVRFGEPEPDWDSLKLFRLCVRLIKAAAARPDQRAELLDLTHALKERVRRMPARRPVAQTHGRYHHDHVFIGGDLVSVIDLDRSRPTDPAKDVAEFLRVLRMTSFKNGLDMARTDEATRAFLDTYLGLVPEAAAGLPFYWSAFLWLSLFGAVKKYKKGDEAGPALFDFHLREMQRAAEMKL